MRWENLTTDAVQDALPGAVVRTFDTPGFAGITFYEIRAKSIISRMPASSRMPFAWTINPYRGCSHACVYCFARKSHTYLDLDTGRDFDSKIVVKVNAPELLRAELRRPSWRGEHIAMGTNVDCYQRAEGRYELMRGIVGTLIEHGNPFSILTKGTLIARDLDLIKRADRVAISFSVGFVDETVWRLVEPGTPSPSRRLDTVRRFTDAGIPVGVVMAPILPQLTDTEDSIEATVAAIAAAGARSVSAIVLHLRPGTREWYRQWLARHYPGLVGSYRRLYGNGSYTPQAYQREVTARIREAARRHGLNRAAMPDHRDIEPPRPPAAEQLSLL